MTQNNTLLEYASGEQKFEVWRDADFFDDAPSLRGTFDTEDEASAFIADSLSTDYHRRDFEIREVRK